MNQKRSKNEIVQSQSSIQQQNKIGIQQANDKVLSLEWQKNQFDIHNLTMGNISSSEFKTKTGINNEESIGNDLGNHNLTVGHVLPSKFNTPGHINGESSRQNSIINDQRSNIETNPNEGN